MANSAVKEEFVFPRGGIADFYMEDHEIEALEREEAAQEFGSAGIATFEPIAHRMASYGRYGDDTVAHVETGELIVPKALIDDNPKLRESIFSHLRELGVEDPERYVVGSSSNSLNPDTGLPEFFLKKLFKKVSKGVSSVAKSVTKVLKKAAPIILPIALAMTPLGPIYGAALGSGIGTLAQGGSLKDAFKSALIAGGTGALFSGASSKLSGGTFGEGVSKAVANPMGRIAQTASGAGSTLTGGGFTGEGNLFSQYVPTASTASANDVLAQATDISPKKTQMDALMPDGNLTDVNNFPKYASSNQTMTDASLTVGADGNLKLVPKTTFDMSTAVDLPTKPPGFFESVKGAFTPGDDIGFLEGLGDAFLPSQNMTATELLKANPGMTTAQANQAIADASSGFLRKTLPSLALAGAGATALGAFEAPPVEDNNLSDLQGVSGADLLAENPEKYGVGGYDIAGATGPYSVASNFAYNPRAINYSLTPFIRPVQSAADGGEIFPRRVGGIMPDEGIPGKDSVRAMLMPGEFVMTTDAVKGLGGGDNDRGINRMYDMMRNLDSRGKAMA